MTTKKQIFDQAHLIELSEDELKERLLISYQNQRNLKEEKKTDDKIIEHREYMKEKYSDPLSDIEMVIKTLRKVCELKNIEWRSLE